MEWFCSDSISLLDDVLSDNPMDPQYSAITAYNRLELYVEFRHLYFNSTIKTVEELLLSCGYSEEDVKLFNIKCVKEAPLYYRDYSE